jgi:hypothetical protein
MLLLDNRTVSDDQIAFNHETYHFTIAATGEDITDEIRRNDKLRLIPDFDVDKDNYRLSDELGNGKTSGVKFGTAPLQDNTAAIFAEQILTDPLAAPLESANKFANKLFKSPAFYIAAGVIVVAILYKKS